MPREALRRRPLTTCLRNGIEALRTCWFLVKKSWVERETARWRY